MNPYPFYILGTVSMLTIAVLSFILILKTERIRKLTSSVKRLQNSLEQMDEQAKLIVRTDLELNKIQEELDKKISGLYTLQKLSRAFASTLDEKEILNQIGPEYIEELGMQKALGFIWQDREKRFLQGLTIGYNRQELDNIMLQVNKKQGLYLKIIEQEKTLSSRIADAAPISAEEIKSVFRVKAFCISPILPKEGAHGFLFVGTDSEEIPITEGDEELITILGRSIGQAFENARLFEASWHAQQELEKRVEQRTQELTAVVKELKNVSKRKSDFVSAVSHELRTPLTSIKGYAAILLSKNLGEIPEPIKERLERINRHSDELVHMVNDLLDISRLESGRIVMKKQSCNLKGLVEGIMELLSVQIKQKDIAFSAEIPAQLRVLVDKSQIERVFVNLIGNAVKFTPEKGKIALTARPTDNFVQVDISDSGIGIPKEAQETIFEEFYRVDNSINEQVKGTGLGLSLVKNIIEAHQGSIWIKSETDAGSTFSFLLPLADTGKG
ncbi:sensor histidine kinase [Candidatus Omnitrophota bacterium]